MKRPKLDFSPEIKRREYVPAYPSWKVLLFFAALFAGAVFAFLVFLRPTYSEGEKRELAAFPAFSVKALLDGSYFDDIDLWFSDTFPMREQLVAANGRVQSLYGLRGAVVYTDNENEFDDDDIPEAPTRPSAAETTTSAPVTTTTTVTTTAPTTVPTTAPTTTAPVTEPTTAPTTTAPTTGEETVDVKPQTLGSILVVGNSGYEYYSYSTAAAELYIGAVSRAATKLEGKAQVYDILVPLAMDIVLDDDIRAGVHSADQKKAIDFIYGSLPSSVRTVDAYSLLREHRNEYLYFRTDHHWTATGAYYAYAAFAQQKGVTPPALTDYKTMVFDNYLGTLYNKTGKVAALGNTPDSVVAYLPLYPTTLEFTDSKGKVTPWRVITDVSNWRTGSQYSTFIGGDNPFTEIHNTALNDGSSCVVVKESFGNAFVPFLVSHYQTVYVIDYRYFAGELVDFVTTHGVQDVIFINNMSASRSTTLMNYVDGLVAK